MDKVPPSMAPTIDLAGNSRPYPTGGLADMECYEWTQFSILNPQFLILNPQFSTSPYSAWYMLKCLLINCR